MPNPISGHEALLISSLGGSLLLDILDPYPHIITPSENCFLIIGIRSVQKSCIMLKALPLLVRLLHS